MTKPQPKRAVPAEPLLDRSIVVRERERAALRAKSQRPQERFRELYKEWKSKSVWQVEKQLSFEKQLETVFKQFGSPTANEIEAKKILDRALYGTVDWRSFTSRCFDDVKKVIEEELSKRELTFVCDRLKSAAVAMTEQDRTHVWRLARIREMTETEGIKQMNAVFQESITVLMLLDHNPTAARLLPLVEEIQRILIGAGMAH